MGKLKLKRSNGCWVDVFDAEKFSGHSRRLLGPAEYSGMRIRERDWDEAIASLNVGPAAYVQCFDSHDFEQTVFWLLPNQAVELVNELDCAETIDSLRVFDRPPFAHEAGYAAYMLWAASQLARVRNGATP